MTNDFSAGDLRVERIVAGDVIRLVWRGSSRDRQPHKLVGPWLEGVLGDAVHQRKSVEMRFDELEYFNSSTVMALIGTIRGATSRGVPLQLVYDGELEWQRLSFEPMRVFVKAGSVELVAAARSPSGGEAAR